MDSSPTVSTSSTIEIYGFTLTVVPETASQTAHDIQEQVYAMIKENMDDALSRIKNASTAAEINAYVSSVFKPLELLHGTISSAMMSSLLEMDSQYREVKEQAALSTIMLIQDASVQLKSLRYTLPKLIANLENQCVMVSYNEYLDAKKVYETYKCEFESDPMLVQLYAHLESKLKTRLQAYLAMEENFLCQYFSFSVIGTNGTHRWSNNSYYLQRNKRGVSSY